VIERREQRPIGAALHGLGEFEVPLGGGVERDAVVVGERPHSRHRGEDAGVGRVDVREGGAGGADGGVRRADALERLPPELFASDVRGSPWGERVVVVERESGVCVVADAVDDVVVADAGAGEDLGRVEPVQVRERGVDVVGAGDDELAGGDVREREAVRVVVVDDGGEVSCVRVGRLEERAGRDDARDGAFRAVRAVVLVGDGDAVAAFDERIEVRREVVDWDARHRVRTALTGLLAGLQVEFVGDEFGVVAEELVEVTDLHCEDVGVGLLLECEELADDSSRRWHTRS